MCPLGGLYIQVTLYINYYSVSLGWSLYTGNTVHQLLQCVPWVVFTYRLHCTSTATVCPLGCLYNTGYTVHQLLQRSLYTGYTVHQLLQCVPWVVFIIQVTLYINYCNVSLGWSLYVTIHAKRVICVHLMEMEFLISF